MVGYSVLRSNSVPHEACCYGWPISRRIFSVLLECRYVYLTCAVRPTNIGNALAKVDLETGDAKVWHHPGGVVGKQGGAEGRCRDRGSCTPYFCLHKKQTLACRNQVCLHARTLFSIAAVTMCVQPTGLHFCMS